MSCVIVHALLIRGKLINKSLKLNEFFLVTFSLEKFKNLSKKLKVFFFIRAEACKKQTSSTALDMTVVALDTNTAVFSH